jgi:hypothetical protein
VDKPVDRDVTTGRSSLRRTQSKHQRSNECQREGRQNPLAQYGVHDPFLSFNPTSIVRLISLISIHPAVWPVACAKASFPIISAHHSSVDGE